MNFVKAARIFHKINSFYKCIYECLRKYLIKYDSAIDVPTVYGMDDRGTGVRVPVVQRIISCLQRSEANSAIYSMGNGGSFAGGKVAGA
jgi:hypothetical protein